MTVASRSLSSSVLASQQLRRGTAPQDRVRIEASASVRQFRCDLADGCIEIELSGDEPDWLYKVLYSIKELSFLPVGWDSYDGDPLAFEAAFAGLQFLERRLPPTAPAPSVVPGSDGGLQLEWHRAVGDLEILVSPEGELSASFVSALNGEEWELTASQFDEGRLQAVINSL